MVVFTFNVTVCCCIHSCVPQDANAKMRSERVKELKDVKDKAEAKSKKQVEESNKKIQALQKRVCLHFCL